MTEKPFRLCLTFKGVSDALDGTNQGVQNAIRPDGTTVEVSNGGSKTATLIDDILAAVQKDDNPIRRNFQLLIGEDLHYQMLWSSPNSDLNNVREDIENLDEAVGIIKEVLRRNGLERALKITKDPTFDGDLIITPV